MANYRGPKCKLCRREAQKLFLKGEKCYTKCTFDKRPEAPGKPGPTGGRSARGGGRSPSRGGRGGRPGSRGGRPRMSDYAVRLREKQKLRRMYGVLEKQFRLYFGRAERMEGITGDNLLCLLERRLDNVVFRLGMAASRPHARQLVTHRHLRVNGRPVNKPSILLSPGDTVEVRERSRKSPVLRELLEGGARREVPGWVERVADGWSGSVHAVPLREQIDTDIQEQLIVEYYSR